MGLFPTSLVLIPIFGHQSFINELCRGRLMRLMIPKDTELVLIKKCNNTTKCKHLRLKNGSDQSLQGICQLNSKVYTYQGVNLSTFGYLGLLGSIADEARKLSLILLELCRLIYLIGLGFSEAKIFSEQFLRPKLKDLARKSFLLSSNSTFLLKMSMIMLELSTTQELLRKLLLGKSLQLLLQVLSYCLENLFLV